MFFEYFIARKKTLSKTDRFQISHVLVRVAIFGIALCVSVMLISVAVLMGFKKEIRSKIISFGSHFQIVNYDSNNSFETIPIYRDQSFISELKSNSSIRHIQPFALKAGIIKTSEEIQGVVLKGVDKGYNWDFFKNNLIEGDILHLSDTSVSNQVLISQSLAQLLKLSCGDTFTAYFVQDPPRMRRFTVAGIYKTDIEEIDKVFLFCDMAHIQKLNNWDKNQISGFEVAISDFDDIDKLYPFIQEAVIYGDIQNQSFLRVVSIKEKFPQIFDWLNLQDLNVVVILILMLAVSGFNMISALVILILDQTNTIGLLKALGAQNKSIRNIFMWQATQIAFKGLFWGNLIGLTLCFLESKFHVIHLEPSTYYISYVPIYINLWHILAINAGTLLVTYLMLLLPSQIISRMSPAETIKFA